MSVTIRMVSRWSALAAVLALTIVALLWITTNGRMFSPGGLSAATGTPLGGVTSHARLAGDCAACHVAPWSRETMDGRCLACHSDVHAELDDTTSLHGSLSAAEQCRACHTEHHGPDGELTRFDATSLDHEQLGFSLATHQTTAAGAAFVCTDCHAARSFAFEAARCETCHREYQPAFIDEHVALWSSECRSCHDGTGADGSGFDHGRTSFPLTGAHSVVECAGCHKGARSAAALAETPTTCIGCHREDDTHLGAMGADCAACHSTAAWDDVSFDHRFPLDHGESGVSECIVCHQDAPESYERYTCYSCHEHTPARIQREHDEEGISRAKLPDCVSCHPTGREHERERNDRRRRDRRE